MLVKCGEGRETFLAHLRGEEWRLLGKSSGLREGGAKVLFCVLNQTWFEISRYFKRKRIDFSLTGTAGHRQIGERSPIDKKEDFVLNE